MPARFLIAATLLGGLSLTILNWVTAAMLPPRYKQFKNPAAVVEAVRANTFENDIFTAPQGLFVAVSLDAHPQGIGPRFGAQLAAEFAVALGLSLLLASTQIRSASGAGALLGLAGLVAGVDTHFPNWNWAGFPTSYLLAGSGYLAVNWCLTGFLLGALRRRLAA